MPHMRSVDPGLVRPRVSSRLGPPPARATGRSRLGASVLFRSFLRSVSLPFMSGEIQVDWPACTVEGCRGRQVAAEGRCLAHTTKEEREAIFAQIASGAAVIAATGVRFSEELLADLLAALPSDNDGVPSV